jgi:hypothetical protein
LLNEVEPHKHLDAGHVSVAWFSKGTRLMSALVAYVDGGSPGNPRPSGEGCASGGGVRRSE